MRAEELGKKQVQDLVAGSDQAGRAFAGRFIPLLRMKIRIRRPGASEAQIADLIQETFVRALAALRANRVNEPDRLGAFVSGVCDNVLLETGKSAARYVPLDQITHEPLSLDDPELIAVLHERAATAEEVMRALPEREREVLRLIFVEELAKDEVCRRFHITREHLRVIVCRAREHLRLLLQERESIAPLKNRA